MDLITGTQSNKSPVSFTDDESQNPVEVFHSFLFKCITSFDDFPLISNGTDNLLNYKAVNSLCDVIHIDCFNEISLIHMLMVLMKESCWPHQCKMQNFSAPVEERCPLGSNKTSRIGSITMPIVLK